MYRDLYTLDQSDELALVLLVTQYASGVWFAILYEWRIENS